MNKEQDIFMERFNKLKQEMQIPYKTFLTEDGTINIFLDSVMYGYIISLYSDIDVKKYVKPLFRYKELIPTINFDYKYIDKDTITIEEFGKVNKQIINFIFNRYANDKYIEIKTRRILNLEVLFVTKDRWLEIRDIIKHILEELDILFRDILDELCHPLDIIDVYPIDRYYIPDNLRAEIEKDTSTKPKYFNLKSLILQNLDLEELKYCNTTQLINLANEIVKQLHASYKINVDDLEELLNKIIFK